MARLFVVDMDVFEIVYIDTFTHEKDFEFLVFAYGVVRLHNVALEPLELEQHARTTNGC